MPDQWEHYGKRYYAEGWESGPSRRQQRNQAANDDPVRDRTPGKKDKSKCKANHWGPHSPSYIFNNFWHRDMTSCGWGTLFRHGQFVPSWWCGHSGRCVKCGKRLPAPAVCPKRDFDNLEPPAWVVEEAKVKTQEYLARRAKWSPRRVIRGPSHYRKPKTR